MATSPTFIRKSNAICSEAADSVAIFAISLLIFSVEGGFIVLKSTPVLRVYSSMASMKTSWTA